MKFVFGDIVVIENNLIGVVVKTWVDCNGNHSYDIYVRMYNYIKNYKEKEIERYMVRHKYLDEEELFYQNNAVKGK